MVLEGDEAGGNGLELELDRLDAELPNLRRAFESATESGDARAALRIAGPLDRYAYLRGRYHEIRQWMDVAVTSYPDAPAGLLAKALLGSAGWRCCNATTRPPCGGWRPRCGCTGSWTTLGASPAGCRCWAAWPGSRAGTPGRWSCTRKAWPSRRPPGTGGRWPARQLPGLRLVAARDFGRATPRPAPHWHVPGARRRGGDRLVAISLGTVARFQGEVERADALLAESLALEEGMGFREGVAWA